MNDAELPPVPERRMPGAWIALGILFLILIVSAFYGAVVPDGESKKTFTQEQTTLRTSIAMNSLVKRLGVTSPLMADSLSQFTNGLMKDARENPIAAQIVAIAKTEKGAPIDKQVLARLGEANPGLKAIYGSDKLSREAATAAIAKVSSNSFLDQMTRVQAREKAGIVPSERDRVAPAWKAIVLLVASLGVLVVIFGSVVVWVTFVGLRKAGRIGVQLPPAQALSGADADRRAWRVFQLIGSFYLLAYLAGFLAITKLFPITVLNLLPSVGILILVFVFAKVPIRGKTISLPSIGLAKGPWGKYFVWGLCGFLAEFPLTLLFGLLGRAALPFLPDASHPATEALMNDPNLAVVLAMMILGAIIAPFWEEVAFRGHLFPALGKVMGGYVPAAVLSSFLFAMIHPQGPQLWFSLASVAVVSCILVAHTKSLVPSILMHLIHNSLLLTMTVLIS